MECVVFAVVCYGVCCGVLWCVMCTAMYCCVLLYAVCLVFCGLTELCSQLRNPICGPPP